MQSGVWKADWFLGAAVGLLFVLFCCMSDVVPGLERGKAAIIAIDQQSMIDILAQAKARAIGYLIFFAEPENERMLAAPAPAGANARVAGIGLEL